MNYRKENWTEDPETEFTCEKCGHVWKLRDSIGCPNCEGSDGGIE